MSSLPSASSHGVFEPSSTSGRRLVHLIPDELAQRVPKYTLFSFAKSSKPEHGFVDVSSATLANAINEAAWWLDSTLGRSEDFESIAYMGPNDLRYFIFMFAAIKAGYKMLYLSPRNSLDGHVNVLERDGCHIFIHAQNVKIDEILERRTMKHCVAPELDYFLYCPIQTLYPYKKSFAEARMDPALVLHTTGSTGLPKPIMWRVGILSTYDAWRTIPAANGCVPAPVLYQRARRAYSSLPLFHTSGLNAGITFPLVLGVTLVLGAPYVVPSAVYTDKMHQFAKVDASMGAPSIYADLAQDRESLERINHLNYIVASGAPLSKATGDLISQHTRVLTQIGATEVACLQRLVPEKEDWEYYYWHPTHSGIEMREIGDNLHELFIVRDPKLQLYQGVFTNFPDIYEWSMNDTYSRHPDPAKSHLWLYCGRKDDVIVLKNGEKITPATMEAILMSNPYVDCAMVLGEGKFQPAALIEPKGEIPRDSASERDLLMKVLPTLELVNKHAPAHGQLDEYLLMFTSPAKPIVRLGQGKIQRQKTRQMYLDEIENLYRAAENGADKNFGYLELHRPDFSDYHTTTQWLRSLFKKFTHIKELSDNQDMFESGVDSLQVIRMSRELRMRAKQASLDANFMGRFEPRAFYSHPNISSLASTIVYNTPSAPLVPVRYEQEEMTEQRMREILLRICETLPQSGIAPPTAPPAENLTILLTGSTGSLGCYLLNLLNLDKRVSNIICLNRSLNAAGRHVETGLSRGLNSPDPRRVQFLRGDLGQPNFDMPKAYYDHLLNNVTHVIHNQWPVNFNYALDSFTPWLEGIRNLIQFSAEAARRPFIFFVSSVSAMGAWNSSEPVPEKPISDCSLASAMGYGRSKLLGELILDAAAKTAGIASACCRVGVVAGPVESQRGEWDKSHYVPSIFISSAYLGSFPTNFPARDRVEWLPVDKTAQIIFEQLLHCSSLSSSELQAGTQLFHAVNPRPVPWSQIAAAAISLYPTDMGIEPTTFESWVALLRRHSDGGGAAKVAQVPACKLLEFYESLMSHGRSPHWQLEKSIEASKTLRTVEAVNERWIRNWMRQWGCHASEGPRWPFLKLT